MGKRVAMNESELDLVSGGAFNFYSRDGQSQCYVDGVGTFNCSDTAATWIVSQMTAGVSPADIADQAMANGYFWK
ncbi:MAG: hypothetical protein IIY55_06685 [Blautia sp.]|nr:hypothetical protein [Blautia sp.]